MNEEREHREPKRSPTHRDSATSGAAVAGLGMQFVVAILLFLFLGKWLDERFGTTPWLLIAGVFLGAGASFYSIYRRLMADQKREDDARKRQ
ncbi:MAG TPA: AtpZ/AtpI family protein [Gemmatimonadaceae bacterium]|nr:AtpZ/AtpI family protein [Gemmatimonadaceae bacterium]